MRVKYEHDAQASELGSIEFTRLRFGLVFTARQSPRKLTQLYLPKTTLLSTPPQNSSWQK